MRRSLRVGLLLVCVASRAAAGTLDVPAQFPTIQVAIDAAVAGDTVLVAPGTYGETIDFHGKAITVVSSGGAASTIIDGGGAGSVVTFASGEGASSILQGFTITGGTGSVGPVDEFGTQGLVGGGVKVVSSSPLLVDLVITGNTAADSGGGVHAWEVFYPTIAGPTLTGCTISGNSAEVGGGVSGVRAVLVLEACVLQGNTAGSSGGAVHVEGGQVTVKGCSILDNLASFAGGVAASGSVPLTHLGLEMSGCDVSGNTATLGAGGFYGSIMNDGFYSGGSIGLVSCRLEGNCAPFGAALNLSATTGGIGVGSCLIAGNGPSGSVAVVLCGPIFLGGCTLVGNLGPAVDTQGCGNSGLSNSIVWDNAQPLLPGTVAVWSDVQGGWPGEGNLDVDPLFVDAAAGDLHLQPGSPCRDAADPDAYFSPGSLDIDLEPRVQGPAVDMGCDEVFTDCNGNGQSDPLDIAAGASGDCDESGVPDECEPLVDCNGNGQPDACDIAAGLSTDCDGNGVPDECESLADCNGNSQPDLCDIASGLEQDCDHDSVPDSCQPFADCNGNGMLDGCDIGGGLSLDCNGNGVPDECDIASGNSLDLDGNGVPDECQTVLMVPGEYPTIQAAIDAAGNGDTIVLADGVFSGAGNVSLDFKGKQLELASLNGADGCIIDGGGTARIAHLGTEEVAGVTIRDLTLRNGQASTGGALLVDGGAIALVEDCRFESCSASLFGGAAQVDTDSSVTFRRCVFSDNTCRVGGALRLLGSDVLVEHCTFWHNGSTQSLSKGGSLSAGEAAAVTVRDSILRDGYANHGPEIHVTATGTLVTVDTSDVEGGSAAVGVESGGALSWGLGNIDADPLFKDTAAGDFRLSGGSPCIDSADPAGPPDADGTPPDMGAIPFAPWQDLGFALAGAGGEPHLEGEGALLPGDLATILLTGAPGDAGFALVLGVSADYVPFKGGTLVPAATVLLGGVTDPDGSLEISGRWPSDVAPGFIATMQVWVVDASGPAGFAASNGLAAEAR